MSIFQAIYQMAVWLWVDAVSLRLGRRIRVPSTTRGAMVVDSSGNLFVADRAAGVIFKVTPTATVFNVRRRLRNLWPHGRCGHECAIFKPYQLAIDEQDKSVVVHMGSLRKNHALGCCIDYRAQVGNAELARDNRNERNVLWS